MAQFMLLLYDDPTQWVNLGPDELQQALGKYMEWRNKPFFVDAQRLAEDRGKVMRSGSGSKPKVTDGPYSETKEVLGGFYVIEAANYDEAVQRAMDHPHLQYGGTVEVRQLWGT
jgi:hypothetical protein